MLFVVFETSKSDIEDELKRKFSKPGGGPMLDDLSIIDDDDGDEQQAKSVTWLKNTSSKVLFDISLLLLLLSVELFDVVVNIDEANKAVKSASVRLSLSWFEFFTVFITDEFILDVEEENGLNDESLTKWDMDGCWRLDNSIGELSGITDTDT